MKRIFSQNNLHVEYLNEKKKSREIWIIIFYFKLNYVNSLRKAIFIPWRVAKEKWQKRQIDLCLAIVVSYNVLHLLLIDTHPFTEMFIKHLGDNMTARDNMCVFEIQN